MVFITFPDVTIYEVIIRYVDKLWTESLLDMTSHRFQALARHLQAGVSTLFLIILLRKLSLGRFSLQYQNYDFQILDVYSDDDWFDQVFVDRFR